MDAVFNKRTATVAGAAVAAVGAVGAAIVAYKVASNARRRVRETEANGGELVAEVLKAHGALWWRCCGEHPRLAPLPPPHTHPPPPTHTTPQA